ncbi:hypothetical protein [Aeoliella sp. SH292]|uniref:hypothetical protein n=1 Tax=Aeoliella sp. SH292 TaxID=3454464 RepID=UPI003F9AE079
MEETPDPADTPLATSCDRAPLGVRVIAGFLIISGTCALVEFLLSVWTGRGVTLGLGTAPLLLGWGMLRRCEWARIWTASLSILSFIGGLLGVVMMLVVGDAIEMNPDVGITSDAMKWFVFMTTMTITMASLAWTARTLTTSRVIDWFHQAPDIPFIEWNPKRWRFGVGTLLFLTVVVAFATVSAILHPGIRTMQAQEWISGQNLHDKIYFPYGAAALPKLGGQGYLTRSQDDLTVLIGYAVGSSITGQGGPEVDYLVMKRSTGPELVLKFSSSSTPPGKPQRAVLKVGDESIQFPGAVQIVEVVNDKIRTSDMRITLLEFWSFHEHPDAVWSLEGLETYVKDLRKRVAERDAARPASP